MLTNSNSILEPKATPDINPIDKSFFDRPTLQVARELLGKTLVRIVQGRRLSGVIVETEAYIGQDDPASHAFRRVTERNKLMYGPPGVVYIYFVYGNHFCLNFVTESPGYPAAVLVRALRPADGVEYMSKYRRRRILHELANGPGKLCQALQINRSLNGTPIPSNQLYIEASNLPARSIAISPRVGISRGKERMWRFYVEDDPFVSKVKKGEE